jgi:outer membrane protein assembly factor BamB
MLGAQPLNLNIGVASWLTYPVYGDCGAVNYTTGELLWKRKLGNIQARNAHGVYEGLLIYPSDDRTIRALDLITGKKYGKANRSRILGARILPIVTPPHTEWSSKMVTQEPTRSTLPMEI